MAGSNDYWNNDGLSRSLPLQRTFEFSFVTIVGVNEGRADQKEIYLRIFNLIVDMVIYDPTGRDFSVRPIVDEVLPPQSGKMLGEFGQQICVVVRVRNENLH
jgi:hypothetical protein